MSTKLDSFKLKGQLLLLAQTTESMEFETLEFDVNDLITFAVLSYFPQKLTTTKRNFSLGKLFLSPCQKPMPLVNDRFQL